MDQPPRGLTRRQLLRGARDGVAAAAGVATLNAMGCAWMPHPSERPARHRCDARYCRFYRAGRCGLVLRDAGGEP